MSKKLDKETMLKMYYKMIEIRFFELTATGLFKKGQIKGSIHPYIGQEAVGVGACFALNPGDYMTTTHRPHGHNLAKGAGMRRIFAEILGKVTGYNRGRGGSMHVAALETGTLIASAVVGGNIPIALGAALTSKMKKTSQVTLCFFGEGASNTGNFHESLNLAAIWHLPVVFMCENNIYAVSTPIYYSALIENISIRAKGYGIPGITVDGNDVIAVYKTNSEAVDRARRGDGPTLIEAKTYRWEGHYVGEPRVYRTREEEKGWKKRDPIKRLEKKLLEIQILNKENIVQIKEEIRKKVTEALQWALNSPLPSAEDATRFIYTD
ncbi:Acetoin:2,6-dichlorophenolindophenol oxidoreductase subunit alpha [subsurface metagenome]